MLFCIYLDDHVGFFGLYSTDMVYYIYFYVLNQPWILRINLNFFIFLGLTFWYFFLPLYSEGIFLCNFLCFSCLWYIFLVLLSGFLCHDPCLPWFAFLLLSGKSCATFIFHTFLPPNLESAVFLRSSFSLVGNYNLGVVVLKVVGPHCF